MYIVRWLMGHPIIAMWFLAAIAILLNMDSGKKDDAHDMGSVQKIHVEGEAPLDSNSNLTPAIIPESTLSGANQNGSADPVTMKNNIESLQITSESYPGGLNPENEITEDDTSKAVDEKAGNFSQTAANTETTKQESVESAADGNENTGTQSEVNQTVVDPLDPAVNSNPLELESGTEIIASESNVGQSLQADDVKQDSSSESVASIQAETSQSANTPSIEISDLSQMSTDEMLLMAREAYWNNGLDEASIIYQELIKQEPQVIEHRGELGNVYWRQGYPKKAAELYSEIAIPMIEQGDSERVANMIGFIGLFYPDRAAEIHQRLQSNSTKSQ